MAPTDSFFVLLGGTAAALLVFVQAGQLFLLLLNSADHRAGFWESLALSYGTGVGLVTWQMLIMSLVGVRFGAIQVVVVWIVAWVIYAAVRWSRRVSAPARPTDQLRDQFGEQSAVRRAHAGEWCRVVVRLVAWSPVLLTIVMLVFRGGVVPLGAWDSWAIWDLKARAFFHDREVVGFLSDQHFVLTHLEYPILYPLAGTLLYLILGQPHQMVQVITALFYAASLVLFFAFLRRCHASFRLACLLTTGWAFLPSVLYWSQHFQPEIPFLFYTYATLGYLYLYALSTQRWFLMIAAFSAGWLALTRPEGLFILVPALLFMVCRVAQAANVAMRRERIKAVAWFASILLLIVTPWFILSRIVVGTTGGVSQVSLLQVLGGLHNVPDVIMAMLAWVVDDSYLGAYRLMFPVVAALILLHWRQYVRPSGDALLLLTAICSAVPGFVLLIILPIFLTPSAMSRYLLAFTAIVYLIFGIRVADAWQTGDNQPHRGWGLCLQVAAALTLATVVTAAPAVRSKAGYRTASWDFSRGDALEWKGGPGVQIRSGPDGLLSYSSSGYPYLGTPARLGLDAMMNRTLRITARAASRGEPSWLIVRWRHHGGDYTQNQVNSAPVRWTGKFQTVVLRPPWTNVIDEFTLEIRGDAPAVELRSVRFEPRPLAYLRLALERGNSAVALALSLLFLAATGGLATRLQVQRVLALIIGLTVLAFVLVPDVSTALAESPPELHLRPASFIRQAADSLREMAWLTQEERLNRVEASVGRPEFSPLTREASRQCGTDGDVLILGRSDNADVEWGGYVFQRGSYLLYPSRVFVHREPDVTALLRGDRTFSALIVYDAEWPANVAIDRLVYQNLGRYMVLCWPTAQ